MLNFSSRFHPILSKSHARAWGWSILFFLTLGLITGNSTSVQAQTAQNAPPELKNLLTQIDAAASSKKLQGVMQFYSPNFTHSDGLTRQKMQTALTQLWQRYPQLNYHTELQSWKREGDRLVVETVTHITGVEPLDGRRLNLNSMVRSRQRIQAGKIIGQEILEERTEMTSGIKPPSLDINLPTQVKVGQEYNFDAIVNEPLGGDMLLGAALEEPVQVERYTKPSSYELESLAAGGIYKIGRAPAKPGNYWVSAVVVRSDGMTMVTRRLQVVNASTSRSSRR